MVDFAHETRIDILRQTAQLLAAENERLHRRLLELTRALAEAKGETVSQLEFEITRLAEQLAARNHQLFGDKSEKRKRSAGKPARAEQPGHGPRAQSELPIVEQVHELDAADQICNACGGGLEAWEGQFEEAEEIDIVERTFRVVRHRRQKYRCRCGGCIETALGPEKLIAGGRYSLDFAIAVAVEKYFNHMPLARQVRDMQRHGLVVDTQTLWDQLWALSRLLEPSYLALGQHVRQAPVIGADETTWRLMESKGTKKWWAWAICRENAIYYELHATRSGAAAAAILDDYGGTVIADGYDVYESLRKQRLAANASSYRLAACWAHARRRFVAAEPNYPQATAILEQIGWLYELDSRARGGPAAALTALRRSAGRLIVEGLEADLKALRGSVLPRSSLGTAIAYTLELWPELTRFLDDPAIPLDNNGTERALRGVALGRKNHYGSRSERGIRVAAIFYSLIESAKLCGVEPAAYLRAVAHRSIRDPKRPVVLLPHQFRDETATA